MNMITEVGVVTEILMMTMEIRFYLGMHQNKKIIVRIIIFKYEFN